MGGFYQCHQNYYLAIETVKIYKLLFLTQFRSRFEQEVQKLITKNLLIARQLLEYYLKQLTLVHFSM